MTAIAVLGEPVRISGYGLVGAKLLPATTSDEIRRCWHELSADVGVVLLTPAAADVLGPRVLESTAMLTVVLPP
jgi:vacuolar-type H+-ATPase subunit F/Vma7